MSDDTRRVNKFGCLALYLVALVPALLCILSAITNTRLWLAQQPSCDWTVGDTGDRLFFLVIGLLFGGFILYPLITGKNLEDWNTLSVRQKAFAALSVMGSVVSWILLMFVLLISELCAQD